LPSPPHGRHQGIAHQAAKSLLDIQTRNRAPGRLSLSPKKAAGKLTVPLSLPLYSDDAGLWLIMEVQPALVRPLDRLANPPR
jgi:hypothetical protein